MDASSADAADRQRDLDRQLELDLEAAFDAENVPDNPPAAPPPPAVVDDVVRRYELMIQRALVDFGDECFDRIMRKLEDFDVSARTKKIIDEQLREEILGPLRHE
jgi:hypothetical protein